MAVLDHVVMTTLHAANDLLDAFGGDVPDWTATAADALGKALEEAEAMAAVEGTDEAFGKVCAAARDLIDGYGGDVPDWLAAEFGAVEEALDAARDAFGRVFAP